MLTIMVIQLTMAKLMNFSCINTALASGAVCLYYICVYSGCLLHQLMSFIRTAIAICIIYKQVSGIEYIAIGV